MKCNEKSKINIISNIDKISASSRVKRISEYSNAKCCLYFLCLECGEEFSKSAQVVSKSRSVKCKKCEKEKLNKEQMSEIVDICNRKAITILSERYVRARDKMDFLCANGHHNRWTKDQLMRNAGCKKCSGLCPEKSKEDFYIKARRRGYEVLGAYEYARKPVMVKHKACGNEFKITPDNLKRGKSCPVCTGHCPDNAKKKLMDAIKLDGYSLLSEYKDTLNHVKVRHEDCGREYMVLPSNFVKGHRCMDCHGKSKDAARNRFHEALRVAGYDLLSEYKNAKTHVNIRHIDCGLEYQTTPDGFISGKRCKDCRDLSSKSARERFLQSAETGGYEVLSKYTAAHDKVTLIHAECGYKYSVTPAAFRQGSRCPSCAKSGFDSSKKAVLYILLSGCGSMIKIGISNNPAKRLRGLKYSTPFEFSPIEQLHGAGLFVADAEKKLHAIGESANLVGFDGCTEWFKYDRDIINMAVKMFKNPSQSGNITRIVKV